MYTTKGTFTMKGFFKKSVSSGLVMISALSGLYGQPEQAKTNLALEKKYTLTPEPNYRLCKDKGDYQQLTDGLIYNGPNQFWRKKGTVGWSNMSYAKITVDLGKVEPIGGVAFHSGFDGVINVKWPSSIDVYVSEDGKKYKYFTDLINKQWGNNGLPPEHSPFKGQHFVLYWYGTKGLGTKGRFVSFVIRGENYLFCDEIKIFRGDEKLLAEPNTGKYIGNLDADLIIRPFLMIDMEDVRENAASLPEEQKLKVEKRLKKVEARMADMKVDYIYKPGYRAIVPLNEAHRQIFRINAEVLRLRNTPPLAAWRKHRWDPLSATEIPQDINTREPILKVKMMNNEYRSDVLNITNTTEKDIEAKISFKNLPGGLTPEYIQLHNVEYVATNRGKMIADALPIVSKGNDCFLVTIPSGMTRQLWIALHPEKVMPGKYNGELSIAAEALAKPVVVPFSLTIAPINFPDKPRLSLGMFDYTDKPYGFSSITEGNVKLAIEDMKKHFVNMPWGHPASACYPEKDDFDADGYLVKELNTKGFDEWRAAWEGSKCYVIYLTNSLPAFVKGDKLGGEKFNRKISQWSAAFAKYLRSKGIAPEKIVFHLFDEPHNAEQYRLNTIWGKAIKRGCAEFRLFTDASQYERSPDELKSMLEEHDIICPLLPMHGGVPDSVKTWVKQMPNGDSKQFMFYSCLGPSRTFDPYYYNLLQAWHCWRNNAFGMAFWNYWNYYQTPGISAWNEILANSVSFGISYTDHNSVTTGKHWEAVREGVEDYEYLAMLKDYIKVAKQTGKDTALIKEAEALLETLPAEVTGEYDKNFMDWSVKKPRDVADQARNKIFDILIKLHYAQKKD